MTYIFHEYYINKLHFFIRFITELIFIVTFAFQFLEQQSDVDKFSSTDGKSSVLGDDEISHLKVSKHSMP